MVKRNVNLSAFGTEGRVWNRPFTKTKIYTAIVEETPIGKPNAY